MPTKPPANADHPDPLWYKDATIYELHVRAFYDSKEDGVGDFSGLAQKLDYLQDLGITAVWLLPFYPSPLRDDGYDIASYTDIHPAYGELREFKHFLREAHRHGLRVITELVLNHTSDQHPWFQRARRAPPGSPHRNFYVWSETPERYREARIIFKDFESSNWAWDPVAHAYYWHRFYSHQPDLNYDSPHVRRAMFRVLDFWLGEIGVDGLRLDAVPYLFERDGTSCENLPETHEFLRALRRHVDDKHRDKMLLAEANQWPEDAVAYFGGGEGDECHTAFHFPLMPRLFMAIRTEDRFPVLDMLEQTPPIPEKSQWVLFLRNHDELTLEMVTDEERDYMYRVYAQDPQARINLGIRRRLAPLLGNSRAKIELMKGLLFSLPGTPVIYYGDEIGMGDNFYLGDRNGVRTPMQWSPDRNAGFSRANSQKLYLPVIIDPEYHYEAVNVEVQQRNPQSLLWWTKRVLDLRKRHKAFGRGSLEFLFPDNRKVLAYLRRYGEETLLVVANLSRFAQHVELNLAGQKGRTPFELFGQTPFPVVGEGPYPLALGSHGFYWFSMREPRPYSLTAEGAPALAPLVEADDWKSLFTDPGKAALDSALPECLRSQPWFAGRLRVVQAAEVVEAIPVTRSASIAFVRVEYTEGEPEAYALPMAYALGPASETVSRQFPQARLLRLRLADGTEGVVYDALWDRGFCEDLLGAMARQRMLKGLRGEAQASSDREIRKVNPGEALPPSLMGSQAGDTEINYGNRFLLKLVRRLQTGVDPDLETGRFLTERAFPHALPVLGDLSYRDENEQTITLAVLRRLVLNEGDAWRYTLDHLHSYFEAVMARAGGGALAPAPSVSADPLELSTQALPPPAQELIGGYLQSAGLLGQRTAELHRELASTTEDPAFAPEPFTALYQRGLVQSTRTAVRQAFHALRRRSRELPPEAKDAIQRALALEGEIVRRARTAFQPLHGRLTGTRIRVHGDFHLERLLYTGKDFVIVDFEGDPERSLTERRLKRSSLRDVAGMIRSFHYAAALAAGRVSGIRPEQLPALESWMRFWQRSVSATYLKRYLETAEGAPFLPVSREEMRLLLTAYLVDKVVAQLAYELAMRPERIGIPLQGLLELVEMR